MQLNNLQNRIKFQYNSKTLSFTQRAEFAHHQLAQQLFLLMDQKKTNLAVAADVTSKQDLLTLADTIGPEIVFLKTHIDIITDFDWDLITQLMALSKKHNFLIVEDRKFCDIGSTVTAQYRDGIYKISEWADIVIAHAISGPGLIQGLKLVGKEKNRGIFLIAHLSCVDNLIDGVYTQKAVELAQNHKDFVIGFIAQEHCWNDPGFLQITPGVSLALQGDTLGQQYRTPDYLIKEKETDIIIVGRGVYKAKDQKKAAQLYRDSGWKAYQQRIN